MTKTVGAPIKALPQGMKVKSLARATTPPSKLGTEPVSQAPEREPVGRPPSMAKTADGYREPPVPVLQANGAIGGEQVIATAEAAEQVGDAGFAVRGQVEMGGAGKREISPTGPPTAAAGLNAHRGVSPIHQRLAESPSLHEGDPIGSVDLHHQPGIRRRLQAGARRR